MSVRFNIPFVGGREMDYLAEVVASRNFAGNGPFTARVERWLEQRFGVPHVLLTHSCTGALELMGLLMGLGPGDEVIVPSYTFCATASAFLRTGATIRFCEIDPATFTADPAHIASIVTERTRVICPIHYAGLAADIPAIEAVARSVGAVVLEDAAQGLGSQLDGRWGGTMTPVAAWSFHETKNLHSGLGGALAINDARLFEKAEDIWERGTNRTKMFKGLVDKYSWVELGSSFYPSELQAAVLFAQLEEFDRNLEERHALVNAYMARLRPLAAEGHFALLEPGPRRQLNWHAMPIVFSTGERSDVVRVGLVERGVQAFIGYVPLHSSQMGQRLGYSADDLPRTESLSQQILRLPLHNAMSSSDVERVCDALTALCVRRP